MATKAEVEFWKDQCRKLTAALDRSLKDKHALTARIWDNSEEAKTARAVADGLEWQVEELEAENAKLRDELERIQPTDCEGNAIVIADTVHMLRSEYDGDHEWDDVVVELAMTNWGGDRWIVRGSRGEAWACDCTKTGHDEVAFEESDDAVPLDDPTLIEAENTKLRKAVEYLYGFAKTCGVDANDLRELGVEL